MQQQYFIEQMPDQADSRQYAVLDSSYNDGIGLALAFFADESLAQAYCNLLNNELDADFAFSLLLVLDEVKLSAGAIASSEAHSIMLDGAAHAVCDGAKTCNKLTEFLQLAQQSKSRLLLLAGFVGDVNYGANNGDT